MNICPKIAATAVTFGLVFAANLGTDPARATIININAQQSGENTGPGGNTGSLINPVQYTFAAGTYEITDAWSQSGGLQPGALYDAWNYAVGWGNWLWDWKALTDNSSTPNILFDVRTQEYSTELGAALAGSSIGPLYFTLPSSTTLYFVVNDYYLGDNWGGGVSLNIEPTPLPAALPLLATGLGALGLLGWRRKRKAQATA